MKRNHLYHILRALSQKSALAFLLILSTYSVFAQGSSSNSSENTAQTNSTSQSRIAGFNFPVNRPAPDLVDTAEWINSEPINSLEELRGQVVLVNFWTYTCINCIHTFPHLKSLYEKYHDQGFEIIAVHTPEFSYEKKKENVIAAVKKYELPYPIVQDNDYKTWRNYNNRYWPAQYLIDAEGNIRYYHFGEGKYEEMDKAVAALLSQIN